jgi:hypothetical protein
MATGQDQATTNWGWCNSERVNQSPEFQDSSLLPILPSQKKDKAQQFIPDRHKVQRKGVACLTSADAAQVAEDKDLFAVHPNLEAVWQMVTLEDDFKTAALQRVAQQRKLLGLVSLVCAHGARAILYSKEKVGGGRD